MTENFMVKETQTHVLWDKITFKKIVKRIQVRKRQPNKSKPNS